MKSEEKRENPQKIEEPDYNWFKKDNIGIFLIFVIAIFYTSTIIFSSGKFIPFGLDFDSNLSPIENMVKNNFSLWDDSWWLGFPDYAGPLSNIFYPISSIIFVIFGVIFGLKLLIFIHILFSGIGFYYFSKYLTKNNFARLYGSIIYMLSGSIATKIVAGHLEKIFVFPWIPIALYFLYKTIDTKKPKYIVFSGISSSMFILAGDLYGALFFCFMFLAFFMTKIISSKDKEMFFTFSKVIILTLLISSIKLIPIFFLNDYLSRDIDLFQGLENIFSVFSRFYGTSTEETYGIWESYSYIGILPFILFIIGAIFHKSKEKYFLILSIIVGLFWVQSNVLYLAKIIHFLPIFNFFRVPTRIYMFLTFYLIALSTMGLDFIIDKSKKLNSKKVILVISSILLFIASYNLYSENSKFLKLDLDQSNEEIYKLINNEIKFVNTNNTPLLITVDDHASITRQHVFIKNGIHYYNAYYGYKFKLPDHINNTNITYSIPDIKVVINPSSSDGQQIQGLLRYNDTLPFAFIVKNNGGIDGLRVIEYQSGNMLVDLSNAMPGDVVVVKTSYYNGWLIKLNDSGNYINANNYQGLVSYQITKPHEKIRFLYIPIDLYIAFCVMLLSIPFSFLFIFKNSNNPKKEKSH